MRDSEAPPAPPTHWRPGLMREIVAATVEQMSRANFPLPPHDFYAALADRGETIILDAVAEAIAARRDDSDAVIANIRIARRLIETVGDDLFLATEQADDAVLARLAAYLVLEGNDGYGELSYECAWGAHRAPDWGTVWGVKQKVRDFTPAFIFRTSMKGDTRLLAVECDAPNRILPDDLHERLRARALVVSGVPVLAFSATEVQENAAACVDEIGNAISVLAQELLAMHGLESPPQLDFRPPEERSSRD